MPRGLRFGFVGVRFVVFVARGLGVLVGALADSARLLTRGPSSARGGSTTAGVATVEVDSVIGVL